MSEIAAYPAPWYVPNSAILAIFVLAHIVQHALDLAESLKHWARPFGRHLKVLVGLLAASVLSISLWLTLCSAYQMRIQQREIEDNHRKQIGLWLRQHASSKSDTVFLEPLGYIGFFSQLKMLDWPGLCAPEVVAAQKRLQTDSHPELILELCPDWLVLRAGEVPRIQQSHPQLLTQLYSAVEVFDVSRQVASYHWLPGRGYLALDQTFLVFKRNKGSATPYNSN